jgi:type IV pilus assembly protein PilN
MAPDGFVAGDQGEPTGTERRAAMTITAERPANFRSMPGWGIAADLIPPELISARRLKALRKLLAAGVVALVAVCAAGFYLAARENAAAAADLASVEEQTAQLEEVGRGYSDVVLIQGSVTQIQSQIAQVMGGDVDLAALMGALQSNLPTTMTIEAEAIVISSAGVAGAAGATGSGLDTSGLPRIGTITMSGTGQTLDDLADYIDRLRKVTGLVDVIPVSNTISESGTGTQYSITIGLTDPLLSHRFDVGAG